ncbi:glycoside hydrolase family 76 protein [Coniophora puteana RWD-64-598 SS2]|uniref:Glycoside hydrolase family 76 protein n=1 Tax=Coniophora puteana (strain RWD-64-598) TaxID=741705 RepID=A0A5M3MBH6_CONPW|nr:glycoside hydrolase family 76 protein [Coniophora puteana RWD-64-598 SS2]EIW75981.1 glycoside hydrolase family 76 protein [Coniophora puteana RWD-64-598 SS2]
MGRKLDVTGLCGVFCDRHHHVLLLALLGCCCCCCCCSSLGSPGCIRSSRAVVGGSLRVPERVDGGKCEFVKVRLFGSPFVDAWLFQSVVDRLLTNWLNYTTGQFMDGDFWVDCNTWEDIENYQLAANSDAYANISSLGYLGKNALDASTNWTELLGGSYDDAQWAILSLWRMADYESGHGQDNTPYLNAASTIYDLVSEQWDDYCGGGGRRRQMSLVHSRAEYFWLVNSGMQNAQLLYNDGLSDNCTNNGQTAWTYNQAVVASGLGALYKATGNATLLDVAETSLDATIMSLTDDGILKEACDDAVGGSTECSHNSQLFKGLWMKHLSYYLTYANDSSRTAKYAQFITAQYDAILQNAMNAQYDIGSVWYAPNQGGSVFQPEASASGLEGILADAQVCMMQAV